MTALNIEQFESQADSSEIEKHFLATAYNHFCFAREDKEWLDEFMGLPQGREIFFDSMNRYMYDCLSEEYMQPSVAPTNDITIASRLASISGCETRAAEEYVEKIAHYALEKEISVWREQILPVWAFHNSRSQAKDYIRNSLDIVAKSCNIKESRNAISYLMDAVQLMEGCENQQKKQHPLLQARETFLGPKLVNRVIRTRFTGLNTALGGGINHYAMKSGGRLIVVAGRPGSGKSTWAMNLAIGIAMSQAKVLLYTLEMDGNEVSQRTIACLDYLYCLDKGGMPLSYGHIVRQVAEREQLDRIASLPLEPLAENLIIADSTNITPAQVAARIKTEKKKNPELALVVLDYLTLMDLDSDTTKQETRALAVGVATRKLKMVALETGVDIVTVCQLNRSLESRNDKRPVMSDLRESGRIEEDADVVIMNYWPSYYDKNADPMDYEYSIVKNRKGATGTCRINFAREFYAMHEPVVIS